MLPWHALLAWIRHPSLGRPVGPSGQPLAALGLRGSARQSRQKSLPVLVTKALLPHANGCQGRRQARPRLSRPCCRRLRITGHIAEASHHRQPLGPLAYGATLWIPEGDGRRSSGGDAQRPRQPVGARQMLGQYLGSVYKDRLPDWPAAASRLLGLGMGHKGKRARPYGSVKPPYWGASVATLLPATQ